MASSSQPFLNTKDSSLNVGTPVFTGYDNNMSVQMLPKGNKALKTPKNVVPRNVVEDDVEDALNVDAYISKLHLTNLDK
jgi:hypothetical protein